MKIKKGDNIIVIAGKDKGRQGKVTRSFPKDGKILVEGVNIVRRRQRPKKQGQKGQTVERNTPINISNAMYFCASCKKGVKLGIKKDGGKRMRFCRKCNKDIK